MYPLLDLCPLVFEGPSILTKTVGLCFLDMYVVKGWAG